MLEVTHATIVTARGSWGSGIATLTVKVRQARGALGRFLPVRTLALHADSGPLFRALDSAFDIITPGHTVDVRRLEGQRITYWMDDLDLCLGGFVPGWVEADEI